MAFLINNLHNKVLKKARICGILCKFASKIMNKSIMKRRCFVFWTLLLLAAASLTSCLKDNDDDTVYYDDVAVTAFNVGTLNRYVHTTTSSGDDSVYVQKVACSSYRFYIDQQQGLIYNVDSLPQGLDLTKVLCTITSKNSGVVVLNKGTEGKDSLVYYSDADSVDVSRPLEVRVYNMKMTDYRKYTLTVNMHQEDGDEFQWTQLAVANQTIAQAERLRVVALGSKAYTLALAADGSTRLLDWQSGGFASLASFEALAVDNAVSNGQSMFVLEPTARKMHVYEADAQGDVTIEGCDASGVERLVGASSKEIYALSKQGGLLVSTDNGLTWQAESLDSDASLLPTDNINCTLHALRTNGDMERVTLVGTRADKSMAVVWMKIVDPEEPGAGQWQMVADGSDDRKTMPRQDLLAVLAYDDADVAYGMSATGTLATVLRSLDGGITWEADSSLPWPLHVKGNGTMAAAVDGNNYIWMVMGGTGQVWRGRLNRLGWAEVQKVFTK